MVTAELAVALPVLVVAVAACVEVVAAVTLQARCADAASAAARLLARGSSLPAATAAARDEVTGAAVTVRGGDAAAVRVTATGLLHPLGGLGPTLAVSGSAAAPWEPGVAPEVQAP